MKESIRRTMLTALATATMTMAFAQEAPKPKSQSDEVAGVQEAIRFERAKDAAAAHQARLEAENAPQQAGRPAEANAVAPAKQDPSAQPAARFERAKSAADGREAGKEAQPATPVVASSKRR
jgi:hypothetical protein